MRVVITGGAGHIGTVTGEAVSAAGHVVVLTDRTPPPAIPAGAQFVPASMDDYPSVRAAFAGADAVVHLAAIPAPEGHAPHVVHNNNVVAAYNALCAAVELGIPRVLMASSVNAIGATWSRRPEFDYFPIDEHHRTRNEDAYSLSKWIGEQQADSVVRSAPGLSVASFRIHMFVPDRADAMRKSGGEGTEKAMHGLWGYTTHRMWADACTRALTAEFTGHRVLWVVAGATASDVDSAELARTHFPEVPLRAPLPGNAGFFDCSTTTKLLGWSDTP